jgi:hypothetical protein
LHYSFFFFTWQSKIFGASSLVVAWGDWNKGVCEGLSYAQVAKDGMDQPLYTEWDISACQLKNNNRQDDFD